MYRALGRGRVSYERGTSVVVGTWGLGLMISGFGFRVRIPLAESLFRGWGLGFEVCGSGFRG